eukprot:COSAG01_NODE_69596_length_261_cov_0.549383_1_plen_64_part_10
MKVRAKAKTVAVAVAKGQAGEEVGKVGREAKGGRAVELDVAKGEGRDVAKGAGRGKDKVLANL